MHVGEDVKKLKLSDLARGKAKQLSKAPLESSLATPQKVKYRVST